MFFCFKKSQYIESNISRDVQTECVFKDLQKTLRDFRRTPSQGVASGQCRTIKVVERDNGIKVHAKDLSQPVHDHCIIGRVDSNVVSRLISTKTE